MKAVIFDLGGTLLYFNEEFSELLTLSHQSMTHYLVEKGFKVKLGDVEHASNSIYETYTAFAETTLIEIDATRIYPTILYQLGIDDYANQDLIKGTIQAFYTPIIDAYHIYQDVNEVLRTIKDEKFKTGLKTNNHSIDCSHGLLNKFDLAPSFDSIVVSSELGVRKPHEGIFDYCLHALTVSHDNAIFIGDRLRDDIQGAKKAGITCVWLNRKNESLKPDDHPLR